MNRSSKNLMKVFLILLGVAVAVLIGFSSSALPTQETTNVALGEMLPLQFLVDFVQPVLGKATNFITHLLN